VEDVETSCCPDVSGELVPPIRSQVLTCGRGEQQQQQQTGGVRIHAAVGSPSNYFTLSKK